MPLPLITLLIHLSAACCLLIAGVQGRTRLRQAGLVLLLVGTGLHLWLAWTAMAHPSGHDVNFLNMLSLTAVLTVAVLVPPTLFGHSSQACILALPAAALCLGLQWLVPMEPLVLGSLSLAVRAHILSSLAAYGLLSIAAMDALLLATQDYALRHPRWAHPLSFLPPLTVVEQMMFRLILVGWLLLSLSLLSGLVFIEDLLAQHLVHKTALSFLSWLLFGLLLAGRQIRGWRGRRAVRWTLAAMALLLLAYFGSKLVLEVFLHRSWIDPQG